MPRPDRASAAPGGSAARSTRSTRAASPTPTGTASATSRGSRPHLDHLEALPIEAIWLSPFFTSPMADFGYDVVRLLRRRPGVRHAGGLRRARRRAATRAASASWSTGCRTTPRTGTRGSPRRARRATAPSATGTSGATAPGRRAAERLALAVQGVRRRVDARRGAPGSTTCTRSCPSSPTSTGTTPRSRRRCTTRCASGSTAGSTASGSTRSTRSPRTRCCATTPARARRHDEDWDTIHERLRGIRRVVDEYEDRMIVGEVALQDLHRIVGYLKSGDQLHLAHNFVCAELPWDAEAFRDLDRRLRRARRRDGVAGVVPLQPRPAAGARALRRGTASARRGRAR